MTISTVIEEIKMKKQDKKKLWIILIIFILFGSTIGYVFLSRFTPREETPQITESLIVNTTLSDEMESRILGFGLTIIRAEYTDKEKDFVDNLKNLQEEFMTVGRQKQILIEKINSTQFSLVIKSTRNQTTLVEPDYEKLRQELCNIVWDPPLTYCFSP